MVGTPPVVPFPTRLIFDRNHGGLGGGKFHSSRVLVDMTVSQVELNAMPVPLAENAVGLPASRVDIGRPNVAIRMPSRVDVGSGQFHVLQSLAGGALESSANAGSNSLRRWMKSYRSVRLRIGNERC